MPPRRAALLLLWFARLGSALWWCNVFLRVAKSGLQVHVAALPRTNASKVTARDTHAVRVLDAVFSDRAHPADIDNTRVDGVPGFDKEVGDLHVRAHRVLEPFELSVMID